MDHNIKQDHTSNNNLESTNYSDKGWRENIDKWSDKEADQVMLLMPNMEDHESNSRDCIETQLYQNGKSEKYHLYSSFTASGNTKKGID